MGAGAAERLEAVRERVAAAARQAGRAPEDVRFLAISKTFHADAIEQMIAAGQRLFGENRVQEAAAKWPALRDRHPQVELHLVGPLQTNKASEAVGLFDAIHSLDRDRLAGALAKEMEKQGRAPTLFVQVNTGEEPQKAGVDPRETAAFLERCHSEHGLAIAGLMCLPPFDEPPGPHFALLAKIAREAGVEHLSMGMSGDFETAIAFGATYVRVGTALFGERKPGGGTDA
ncbi:MAG TPA: YggS family pyridoxal phosphate-dependent enzyme [Afifellaceae bacterium]|nr:YggS family pyridoxal phosphate-dependent enzyme [Afifellaceae bacterium]